MKSSSFVLAAFTSASIAIVAAACSSDPTPSATDAGVEDAGDATTLPTPGDATVAIDASPADAGADVAYVEPTCALRDDPGGPGQYSDTCVRREWIAAYAGTYTSAACELTVAAAGPVAASFTMKVLSGKAAGSYTIAWGGGTGGAGNDSYYRFTTDATFATTKILNFNAGEPITGGERNASLRVEAIDTGTPRYTGSFSEQVGATPEDVDCGTFTKR